MKSSTKPSIKLNVTPENHNELMLIVGKLKELNAISDTVYLSTLLKMRSIYAELTIPIVK